MNASQKNLNILVTAAGGPSGINALRLLKNQPGITAYATDIDPLAAVQFFAAGFATMAKYKNTEQYALSLKKLIADWKIDAVFPTLAEELAGIEEILADTPVKIIVSPKNTVKLCDDKRSLYAWVDKEMPEAIGLWQTLDQQLAWNAEEYFLKPAHGRGGTGCRIVSRAEIEVLRKNNTDAKSWILMELLPGTEWTVDAYVRQTGEIEYIVPRERLEVASGISLKGRTVRRLDVMELTQKLLQKMPCWGPVCIQWKADKNNIPKLVEVNPRLSGGALITALAGADPMKSLIGELQSLPHEDVCWMEKTVVGYFEYKSL